MMNQVMKMRLNRTDHTGSAGPTGDSMWLHGLRPAGRRTNRSRATLCGHAHGRENKEKFPFLLFCDVINNPFIPFQQRCDGWFKIMCELM